MKKITYSFINPNTDDETAKCIAKILSKAIAERFVYANNTDNSESTSNVAKIPPNLACHCGILADGFKVDSLKESGQACRSDSMPAQQQQGKR